MVQRTEVLTIVAHLIISLFVFALYGYTAIIGKPDITLQSLCLIIGGYWFGAMGKTMIDSVKKKSDDSKNDL